MAVGLIPVIGDIVDIAGAAVGRDLIAGESLSGNQRSAMALGTLAGSGRGARQAGDIAASAVMRRQFDNVVRPGFWKNQAANNAGAYSAENIARMAKGKAPIGSDGYPMELHHRTPLGNGGTNDISNLQMMTRSEHRLGENYRANHPDSPPEEDD